MSNEEALLEAALRDAQGKTAGATADQLDRFETRLGIRLPALLRRILMATNGGDFCFGRFEASPFIPAVVPRSRAELLQDLWDRTPGLAPDLEPPADLLPLCSDYSSGMSCLDLSDPQASDPPVVFWSWDDDSVEDSAPSFQDFVAASVRQMQREQTVQSANIRVGDLPTDRFDTVLVPALQPFGVTFSWLDPQLLIDDDRQAPHYRPTAPHNIHRDRAVAFTMHDGGDVASYGYGVVQTANTLKPGDPYIVDSGGQSVSNGSGIRYLTINGRRLPVLHVTLEAHPTAGCELVIPVQWYP